MKILGINSAYHESAAALVIDGELVCFIEEERINRVKHAKNASIETPHQLPTGAMKSCIKFANLEFSDIDLFAYSFSKEGRLENIGADTFLNEGSWGSEEGENLFHSRLQQIPEELKEITGLEVEEKLVWVDHHLAHAASAFLCSPITEAIILVVDGIGEFDTLSAYIGRHNQMGKIFSRPYPHSLGFLWEKICKFLGFSEHDACKLMGLSSYGDPAQLRDKFNQLARSDKKNFFTLNNDIARFRSDDFSELEKLFGPARKPGEPIEMRHKDLAATIQEFTNQVLLDLALKLKNKFRIRKLCLAGGTTLNCIANSVLLKQGGFSEIFVQPAANDAGTALGAALYAYHGLEEKPRTFVMQHAYWGPSYDNKEITNAIKDTGFKSEKVDNAAKTAAKLISQGNVVGWFQGRMEAGPRALGNRSLLADPRRKDMREILNRKVKHREDFRPFAPSVLAEEASIWFDFSNKTRGTEFMLFTCPARKKFCNQIPAVTHIDNTSRIQVVKPEVNKKYHELIKEFADITGVPMVLNTSFNDSEPIVMTPKDALNTFNKTGIDALFLGDHLILKNKDQQKT